MSLPLCDHLASVADRVKTANHLLLGLDYDGTLTPIVDDPARAILADETRQAVAALAAQPNATVAVVSGRGLEDVQTLVGIDSLIYAGNHGLEIRSSGLSFTEPTAVRMHRALGWLAACLAKGLAHIRGAMVENKTLTISVHYRHVHPTQVDELLRHVQAAAAVQPECFHITRGNCVLEVRPRVDWHKGFAMRWLAARLAIRDTLILYAGDDTTDEDAFATLGDGITLKCGEPGATAAHYHVKDPSALRNFLGWLATVRQ